MEAIKEGSVMTELVSAIITTCKRDSSIVHRAILSVLNQSYRNIEIIVVDDSPSEYQGRDDVRDMVEAIGQNGTEKIQYIRHDKCQGACVARNTGIEHSSGTYIGFLDDDDEWLPEKIESLMDRIQSDNCALVYCNNEIINETSGDIRLKKRTKHEGKVYEELILGNFIGSTSFPLIKKDSLIAVGGFDVQMDSAQDYDVWLRLASKYDICYVDKALNRYHVHEGEQITKNPQKKINGLERLNEKNFEYLNRNRNAFWIRHMKIIPFYLKKGDKEKAVETWKECVLKCPGKIKGNIYYLRMILTNGKGSSDEA